LTNKRVLAVENHDRERSRESCVAWVLSSKRWHLPCASRCANGRLLFGRGTDLWGRTDTRLSIAQSSSWIGQGSKAVVEKKKAD